MFKKSLIVILLSIFTVQAQAGWFSSLVKSVVKVVVQIPIIGNIVDNAADAYAHRKLNSSINSLVQSGRACSPREKDSGLDVEFWLTQKPGFPGWQELDKLDKSKNGITARGNAFGTSDKVKHCYLGCLIRKEVGYSSAVLSAWYKELQDLSDCNSATHFEIQDKDATVGGAIAGGKSSCESFCGRSDLANASGSKILEAAQNLPNPSVGRGGGIYARFRYMAF